MDTASAIERILSHGKKSSTYKLAVLRAIVDFVVEHPAREPRNGFHLIPLIELARRALAYYWRPALEAIPQGLDSDRQRIPRLVADLSRSNVTVPGLDRRSPSAGYPLSLWIEETPALSDDLVNVLVEIRRTLLEQPIRYIHNVGDDQSETFSVLTTTGLSFSASYDAHRKAASGCEGALKEARTWLGLTTAEMGYIVLSARSYEEISALRFWLRDAIIIRWARECERFAQGRVAVPVHTFELELPNRDSERMRALKALYCKLGLTHCLYTDAALGNSWDLDHLLPWSRFPVNLFWNLVPASPKANRGQGGKSDGLPTWDRSLRKRYIGFLERCLGAGGEPIQHDVSATYQRYFQRPSPPADSPHRIAEEIFAVVENSHARLLAAGAQLWTPT